LGGPVARCLAALAALAALAGLAGLAALAALATEVAYVYSLRAASSKWAAAAAAPGKG
jgi:hypothetical protein